MGTFADALFAALRREEARGRGPEEKAPAAPAMVDLHACVAASIAGADDRPAWARTLGLSARADEQQVQRAFKKRAFETHPDRGGSHEAFLAVFRARDEALAAIRAKRTSDGPSATAAASASAAPYARVVRERAHAPRTAFAM